MNYSMNPYSGPWEREHATHLLGKTTFGPTREQIDVAVMDGLGGTLSSLLTIDPINNPVTHHSNEAVVSFGGDWTTSVYPSNNSGDTENARKRSLLAWIVKSLMFENNTITQKMTLFLHNHFGLTFTNDSRANFDYWMLLSSFTLGNFKTLIRDITIHPAMLDFLNGTSNIGSSPNENYARELLELFTLGKTLDGTNGDFGRYTDIDVAEAARILSGYSRHGMRSSTVSLPYSQFTSANHDGGQKILSSYLGNAVIPSGGGDTEYYALIDAIFSSSEIGTFICKEIYSFFIKSDIDVDIETYVIPEMVQTFIGSGFEIMPVLQQLFESEHFYDSEVRACNIQNPAEFLFSAINPLLPEVNYDLYSNNEIFYKIYSWINGAGMDFASPPSVAGWPAYYQTPVFSTLWYNEFFAKKRKDFPGTYIAGNTFSVNGNKLQMSFLDVLDSFSSPNDPVLVVQELAALYIRKPLHPDTLEEMRLILTGGLPNFEWTIQYDEYASFPTNTFYSDPIVEKIKLTLERLFNDIMFNF